MSLVDRLSAWLRPFMSSATPPVDTEDSRRRQVRQARESAVVLRQLRAELHLMRRWRDEKIDRESHQC